MRYPQIILFEADAAIAQCLEPTVQERRWLLKQVRQAPACLGLLHEAGPAVLVLRVGRHLLRELAFLDEVHEALPDVPVVAVADAEDYLLLRLLIELGASYVLMPPQPRTELEPIVTRILEATIRRMIPATQVADEVEVLSTELPDVETPGEPNP
jgi:DNA-binding NtrC family response regulator